MKKTQEFFGRNCRLLEVNRLLLASMGVLFLPSDVNAQIYNGYPDTNWNIAGNWSAPPVPGSTTYVRVGALGSKIGIQNLGNPFVLNAIKGWTELSGNGLSFAGTNAYCEWNSASQCNVPLILGVDTKFRGGEGDRRVYINAGISGAGQMIVDEYANIELASAATNTGGVLVAGGSLLVSTVNALPATGEISLVYVYGRITALSSEAAQSIDQLRMDGGNFFCHAALTVTGAISLRSGILFGDDTAPIVANGPITKTTSGQASVSDIQMNGGVWNQQGKLAFAGVCSGDILNEAEISVYPDSHLTTYLYSVGTVTLSDSTLTTQMTNQGDLILMGTAMVDGDVTNLAAIKVLAEVGGPILQGNCKINANVSGAGTLLVNKNTELNGLNSYSGGSACNESTVWGDTDGIQGKWEVDRGVLHFDQMADGVMSGDISGTGSILIDSSNPSGVGGRVTLSGDNGAFNGPVNADGGNLGFGSNTAVGVHSLTAGLTQPSRLSAVGDSRSIDTQLVTGGSLLEISGTAKLALTDVTAKTFTTGILRHNSTKTTTISGAFLGHGSSLIDVQSGSLVLGRNQASGFRTDGTVVVASGASLKLLSSNFAKLGVTILAGGTISASNGLVVGAGGTLIGSGTVASRVAVETGAVIIANGEMQLGDANSFAGFFSQGELQVDGADLTILDRNLAVMGSLTTMLNGGSLSVPQGMVVDFGRAIEGEGTVSSLNNLASAMIINGDAAGLSASKRLALDGYVKGLGTFTDVDFLGTFSPGLSPAMVAVNFSNMGGASTLEMELGGTAAGSEYDQLSITGGLSLAGTMKVTLINGFTPSAGQYFQLFDGATSGSFDTLLLPSLPAGLFWHTSQLYSDGLLSVGLTPENYAGFASLYALTTAASGDQDHDGFSNLLEYALGSNPLQSASPGVSATTWIKDEFFERFSFSMPKPGTSDVTLTIQSSADLFVWIDLAKKEGPAEWTGVLMPLLSPLGLGRERIELQQSAPFPPKRFYRLHVLLND